MKTPHFYLSASAAILCASAVWHVSMETFGKTDVGRTVASPVPPPSQSVAAPSATESTGSFSIQPAPPREKPDSPPSSDVESVPSLVPRGSLPTQAATAATARTRNGSRSASLPARSNHPSFSSGNGNGSSLETPSSPTGAPQELLVPEGARLPAAIVNDAKEEMTPEQTKATKAIAKTFLEEVPPLQPSVPGSDAVASLLDPQQKLIWEDVRSKADEQYRGIFGDDAYSRKSITAAKEALTER